MAILGLGEIQENDSSLIKVQKSGEFVIGGDVGYAPMFFRNTNFEIVGFDVDIAKEVAKRLGVKLTTKGIN